MLNKQCFFPVTAKSSFAISFDSGQVIVRLTALPLTRCISLPWYWTIIWLPSHESRLSLDSNTSQCNAHIHQEH